MTKYLSLKIAVLSVLLIVIAQKTNAQDIILTKSSDVISAKILEITSTEVKYKKFSNQDGPTFTLQKSDVVSVTYSNGEKDVFEQSNQTANNQSQNVILWCNLKIAKRDYPNVLTYDEAVANCPVGYRLPTIDELECMSNNKYNIGLATKGEYWSNTVTKKDKVYSITMNDGNREECKKKEKKNVRYVLDD